MPIVPPTLRAGTRDLPTVPPLAQYLIGCFLGPILAWVETALLRRVLTRCADHPLVQIAQWYDPIAVVDACASYYHADGTKGAPPSFTIDLLVRAEIVRAWADSCSDRDLEWHLLSNLIVRWFVGLPLLARAPDHTTLARFHVWLAAQQPAALFDDVLHFLDRNDPEDAATTPQIVDTFAMETPAAWAPRPANLLLDLCADLIVAWQQLPHRRSSAPCRRSTSAPSFSQPVHGTPANARRCSSRRSRWPSASWPISRRRCSVCRSRPARRWPA